MRVHMDCYATDEWMKLCDRWKTIRWVTDFLKQEDSDCWVRRSSGDHWSQYHHRQHLCVCRLFKSQVTDLVILRIQSKRSVGGNAWKINSDGSCIKIRRRGDGGDHTPIDRHRVRGAVLFIMGFNSTLVWCGRGQKKIEGHLFICRLPHYTHRSVDPLHLNQAAINWSMAEIYIMSIRFRSIKFCFDRITRNNRFV